MKTARFFVLVAIAMTLIVGCADILGLDPLVLGHEADASDGAVPDAGTTDN